MHGPDALPQAAEPSSGPFTPVLDRQHRRLAEIEYLRAAAILLVIVMHAPLLCVPYPPGALLRLQAWIHPAVGVDLFFVISGYLIGQSFVGAFDANEPGEPDWVIAAFWVRRFYRLLPACAVWVGFTLICSIIFDGSPLWLPPHAMYIKALASLFAIRNFEESYGPTQFGYLWSLSVENQFYLALPLVVLVIPRRWRVPGLVALCGLNAVWRPGGQTWWMFRYDGLIYGLLLFELERGGYSPTFARCLPQSRGGRLAFMVCAGGAMLTAPLILINSHPLAWSVVNWAAFALVFAASVGQGAIPMPRLLSVPFLWLGARSYSLYLCHIPVWTLVTELLQRAHLGGYDLLPLRFALALGASLMLADLSYLRVELPLQARGRTRARAIVSARWTMMRPIAFRQRLENGTQLVIAHAQNRVVSMLSAMRQYRALPPAMLLVAYLLLVWFRFVATTGSFRNSDDAANFLAGVEMGEGNWSLHGWYLAAENYVPTDVFALAVLRRLFGWHPIFMQGLETLIWAAIAVLGTAMACRGAQRRQLVAVISLALSLLAFNLFEHGFRDVVLSNIGSHGSTILLTLASFALVARTDKQVGHDGQWPGTARLLLLGCIVVAGSMADRLFYVIACLPIVANAILNLRTDRDRRRSVGQLGTIGLAILVGHEVIVFSAHNGGFTVLPIAIALASFPHLLDHLAFAAESIARLLGAEFFGRPFTGGLVGSPLIYLLRAPLVLMFAITVWEVGGSVVRRVRSDSDGCRATADQELEHLLWLSLAFSVASACMTTVIIKDDCVRFFLPAAVAGSILLARIWKNVSFVAWYGCGVLLVSIIVGSLRVSPDSPRRVVAIPMLHRIVGMLYQHDLHHGFSGYWEGTSVTALSNRESISLPIYEGEDGRLHPLRYFDNADWFRDAARDWHGRIFFISWKLDHDMSELSPAAVYRRFGKPAEHYDAGECVIDVYNFPPHALNDLASLASSRALAAIPPPP